MVLDWINFHPQMMKVTQANYASACRLRLRALLRHISKFCSVQILHRRASWASGLISFEKLAEKFAGSVAVISDGRSWTYKELDERANQFARLLIEHGVKPGDRIGLLLDRSAETYVTLLAVMKAGAAYVPLATAFPEDRMALIIDDAGVRLVISLRAYSARVEQMPVPIY